MIDITTLTPAPEPLSGIESAVSKSGNRSKRALWIMVIIIIAIFGIWWLIINTERQNKNNPNSVN